MVIVGILEYEMHHLLIVFNFESDGIFNISKLVHPLKQYEGSISNDKGRLNVAIFVNSKQYSPIVFKTFGRIIFEHFVHLLNA